ncbi:hypothetical protein MKOR_33260 [Mycolicibacillus koreensis]|uniref:hypothetical protein n=1 Tax=Mycolicibacillus koreensis TaxID=1069220 RepID=UPI00138B696E|nr:hypothetical protein [Mycolicibacillus koreensis]BBY56075.1 hypothetical protein MKOR_33260 [Mycolicibacillus koreensis]
MKIILGKVRPFLRHLTEAHPQVLIIAHEGLHLGNVHIWSVNDGTDALSVCYTGTDFSHHDVEDT